jgi:hypothetical protein
MPARGEVASEADVEKREHEIEVLLDGEGPVDPRPGGDALPPAVVDDVVVGQVGSLREHGAGMYRPPHEAEQRQRARDGEHEVHRREDPQRSP